mgnify:CR=1 FL=1
MDRKNMLWQSLRKKLKREYNREVAAYEAAVAANDNSSEIGEVESEDPQGMVNMKISSSTPFVPDMSTPIELEAPEEVDYVTLEEELFGDTTRRLEHLKQLRNEVYSSTDKAIQALRYASMNISQKDAMVEAATTKSKYVASNATKMENVANTELNLWMQLVLWLESQYFTHETGSVL